MEAEIAEYIRNVYVEELGAKAIVIRFSSCNYNCRFCGKNHILQTNENTRYDLKEFRKELRNSVSEVEYVYMTGGEVSLQRGAVVFFAKFARENKLKVAIKTNGTKPDLISILAKEDLLDDVVFNLYSPLDEELFNKVTKSATFFISANELIGHIRQSLAILEDHNKNVSVVFRTKVVPTLVFRKEHFLSLAEIVSRFDNSFWSIIPFSPENVKDKVYSGINPPTRDFVETIKENVLKEYPSIRMLN